MGPWMGALDDNLEVLGKTEQLRQWGRAATNERSLAYQSRYELHAQPAQL
jgi:predicted ribonuclease YlaK